MAIPVSRVRELARASGRARSGVSVTTAYWSPNKSLPVKSIPRPSGKRRNDGLLSQNRETLDLKMQHRHPLSLSFFLLLLVSSLATRHSPQNHFLCTNEKIKRKINLRVRKRTVGNGEKLNNFLISFHSSPVLNHRFDL